LIELFCQNAYMVFQVVQVFLITTLTSAASAAFTQVLENPTSATTLLSANLPKASNFYVSYFILQGLATSASNLVHFFALFRHQILRNSSDNPRILSKKWHRLRRIHWGGIFPVYTNMAVIGKFIHTSAHSRGRRCYVLKVIRTG
jgi:calcium permeable stress-gated cation channel